MALEWCLQQEKSDACWKTLYEVLQIFLIIVHELRTSHIIYVHFSQILGNSSL